MDLAQNCQRIARVSLKTSEDRSGNGVAPAELCVIGVDLSSNLPVSTFSTPFFVLWRLRRSLDLYHIRLRAPLQLLFPFRHDFEVSGARYMTTSETPILHTALKIQTAVAQPDIHSLQWGGDGQLFFLTKTSIYILVSVTLTTISTDE